MKKFSKIMAVVLTMLMMFSFAGIAAADPAADRTEEKDGSVTVTNTVEGQTYTLYILFKADMGANDAITYTANGIDLSNNEWFELNSNGFVVAKDNVGEDWAKDPEAIAWAKSVGTQVGEAIKYDGSGDVAWTGLEYGYYFVDTSLGAFIGVNGENPDVEIAEKNEEPSIDKEIVSTTSGVVGDDPDKTAETDAGANEAAIAQVGDTVNYQVTVTAKAGAENYIVTDTLAAGLTAPAAADVTVAGLTVREDYTVDVTGQVITITFTKDYLDTITTDTEIVITYPAVVNENAVIGEAGNANEVTLQYGHDPSDDSKPGNETPPDDTKVYVAKISLTKTDGTGAGLAGAVFALKNGEGKYYAVDGDGVVSWVDDVEDATTFTSQDDGTMDGEFTGLANGSYTLEEITVPDGYNEIDPDDDSLQFTIAGDDYTDANLIQDTTVVNNAGTVLPSTGGVGTTIFYIAGSMMVLGAAVLLVTRRRMAQN